MNKVVYNTLLLLRFIFNVFHFIFNYKNWSNTWYEIGRITLTYQQQQRSHRQRRHCRRVHQDLHCLPQKVRKVQGPPSGLFITAYVETDQDTFSLTHGENNWHHPNENFNKDLWNDWLLFVYTKRKIRKTVYFLLQWYKAKILKINRRENRLILKLHIFGSIS